ncbi:MAG TPA: hypothetical protein DCX89_07030 [Saprospirales bacterium]|nr:hypothetical protein [Saprospirales bacterium]
MYVGMYVMFPVSLQAQDVAGFEKRMQVYMDEYLRENLEKVKEAESVRHHCSPLTEEAFVGITLGQAKTSFIMNNYEEYMITYFSSENRTLADTFICDNGGFEDGFQYYHGYSSFYLPNNTFFDGSDFCYPVGYIDNLPVQFIPSPLPTQNRFEIVTQGLDNLVGINKVKFGNKAARINSPMGHNTQCYNYESGIDRLVKSFKVTSENKDFTVWYAAVLENPTGHINSQPFISIKCDRSPGFDLCFDADSLKCEKEYYDSICTGDSNFDVLNWTCHRIKIPDQFIDSIATLEITIADCGFGGHRGYAYIDGICEPCYGSALGSANLNSINYVSCYEEFVPEYATVCGKFTLPTLNSNCNYSGDPWELLSINVPGFQISNVTINQDSKTFCFNFPITNFGNEDCLDIYLEMFFSDGTDTLPPQESNTIEICQNEYTVIECESVIGPIDTCGVIVDIKISGCQSNGTGGDNDIDQTPNISDDYYYVYLTLYDPDDLGWSIGRELVEPYPNEEDLLDLGYGTGDTINMILGPFLIQEGDWWIHVYLPDCDFTTYIDAPDYCSGCDQFRDLKVGNVECYLTAYGWRFNLYVPNENSNATGYNLNGTIPKNYNIIEPIIVGPISGGCKVYTLSDIDNPLCTSSFTICPPKPCVNCDLDVIVKDVECVYNPKTQTYTGFKVHLDLSDIDPVNEQACVGYSYTPTSFAFTYIGFYSDGSYDFGPFTDDVYMYVRICNRGTDCATCTTSCYKYLYIPKPDCVTQKEIEEGLEKRSIEKELVENQDTKGELIVIPNPFSTDEVIIRSALDVTVYEIFDMSGRFIQKGSFKGREERIKLNVTKGTYFIRYHDKTGKPAIVRMIKL